MLNFSVCLLCICILSCFLCVFLFHKWMWCLLWCLFSIRTELWNLSRFRSETGNARCWYFCSLWEANTRTFNVELKMSLHWIALIKNLTYTSPPKALQQSEQKVLYVVKGEVSNLSLTECNKQPLTSPGDSGVIPNWDMGVGEATTHFRSGDRGVEGNWRAGRRENKDVTRGRGKGAGRRKLRTRRHRGQCCVGSWGPQCKGRPACWHGWSLVTEGIYGNHSLSLAMKVSQIWNAVLPGQAQRIPLYGLREICKDMSCLEVWIRKKY